MTHDPILSTFSIVFRRLMLFILVSLLLALIVWCWLLMVHLDVPTRDLIEWVRATWTPGDRKLPAVFAGGSLAIGILTASIIYLLVARWWKKRGDVHRRGARFEGEV